MLSPRDLKNVPGDTVEGVCRKTQGCPAEVDPGKSCHLRLLVESEENRFCSEPNS